MTREITKTIFRHLSPEQIDKIMSDFEKLAKEKHTNICMFYGTHPQKDDIFEEDLEELIEKSEWTSYLPEEYYLLKTLRNEQREAEKSQMAS